MTTEKWDQNKHLLKLSHSLQNIWYKFLMKFVCNWRNMQCLSLFLKPLLSCILPSRITFNWRESFSSTSRLVVISDSSGTTLISEFTCMFNAAALFSEIELPYYSSLMKGSKYWLWLSLESYLNMTTLADNCFNCKPTNF